jgi:hypothetical protein
MSLNDLIIESIEAHKIQLYIIETIFKFIQKLPFNQEKINKVYF